MKSDNTAPPVTASIRDYSSGQPIPRNEYEIFLRNWMDRAGGKGQLPLLDAGEAHVVAALLDELAGEYKDEPLGRLAREMAVRINDRMGI
ncbi:hypothetical protein [Streptosporangium sp. NPDC002524]|uniref:hypothetical protein n=1 Tax=Streptosporangium sp. NPDC002524 TaxID=3154537 RepID=UPI003321AE31